MTNKLVIDVSGWQPQATDVSFWNKWIGRGAKGGIVKLSEDTNFKNNYAARQIQAIKQAGLKVSGYHFSRFRNDSTKALQEANYAIQAAREMGLPSGAPLVLDYEEHLGERNGNTQASIVFLNAVKNAGYVPVFYSYEGASTLWDFNAIHQATGAMLWIAKYPTMDPVYSANMAYFPSISDYTGAWQFSSNFYGEGIDASVDVTGIFTEDPKVTSGGHFDGFNFNDGKVNLYGWFGSDQANDKPNRFVIVTLEDGKEVGRVKLDKGLERQDVAKVYPDIPNGNQSGFAGLFDFSKIAGHKINVYFRYSKVADGNSQYVDYVTQVEFKQSYAWLDSVSTVMYANKLRASGWFASNAAYGLDKRFIILWDATDKKEIQRVKIESIKRDDVQKVHPDVFNSGDSGFSGSFDYTGNLVGHKLQVIARYSDSDSGEGKRVDYWFDPFDAPAMPTLDGKTEASIVVHEFSAKKSDNGMIELTFK